MKNNGRRFIRPWAIGFLCVAAIAGYSGNAGNAADAPRPLLAKSQPVDWWFVFKFNAGTFPGCRNNAQQACPFGGDPQEDATSGQQYVYASSANPVLKQGDGCAGDTTTDPIGATFDEVYNGSYYYVVWNDQFYNDPRVPICGSSCGKQTGHSKGMLAWSDTGEGFVLQVSTPSWPGSGSKEHSRKSGGNTLGCIEKPNNILFSQHFFALRLNKDDVLKVLQALENASVASDPKDPQIVKNNGGPEDIQRAVNALGRKSDSTSATIAKLSSGVQVVSKAANLNVAPWQMLSSQLGGVGLRAATWWNNKKIYSTTPSSKITCWDNNLSDPGPVEIALSGQFGSTSFRLTGGGSFTGNHAKIGVSTSGDHHYAIFGDMNQEGSLLETQDCTTSQNARGGVFYVVEDDRLFDSVRNLIQGDTAPTLGPTKTKKKN
jgi:hypothetical protein